jgi:hypothetical protein
MSLLRIVSRLYVSRKKIASFSVSAFIIGLVLGALLLNFGGIPNLNTSNPSLAQSVSLLSAYMGSGSFIAALPEMTLLINASQYPLPVNLTGVEDYESLKNWLQITPEQEQLLSQNGFVVLRVNSYGTLADFYNDAYDKNMPIMITTDAVLHTYHVLFDETLKQIETNEFIGELNSMINTLLVKAQEEAESVAGNPLETASKLNLMYLEVAHALMQPSFTPTTVEAQQELQLISDHNAMTESPIFGYKEDYTQYVPRGHYTESEQLEAYFKTMMWFGRMRFALLTNDVVDVEQTRAAILLTWMVTGNESTYNVWQRIYDVTKFFVGVSDDLTFEDYSTVLSQKGITVPEQILNENTVGSIANDLLNMSRAKILGTYAMVNSDLPQQEELQGTLNETAGLRFMGQRFIPDSYMLQQLVFPQVGTSSYPRLLPKGLDVSAVLGSSLAKQILDKTEAAYANYEQQIEKLGAEFGTLSTTNWTQNLYWSWLYTANTTLAKIPSEVRYPTFMTTPAWGYEKLQTFEGTWTELRHDTILYAKQSFTGGTTSVGPPPPPPSTAYVESYPDTYRRMIGLLNMTINGLTQFGLLSHGINASLTSFMDVSELFLNASTIELEGRTLDGSLQHQIREAAKEISTIVSSASEKVQKAAIVADVHTDPNTGRVLEEALGNFSVVVVIYADADGSLHSTAGPVYNYYEFSWPMSNRLTDETWRGMLATHQTPETPEWTNNFAK